MELLPLLARLWFTDFLNRRLGSDFVHRSDLFTLVDVLFLDGCSRFRSSNIFGNHRHFRFFRRNHLLHRFTFVTCWFFILHFAFLFQLRFILIFIIIHLRHGTIVLWMRFHALLHRNGQITAVLDKRIIALVLRVIHSTSTYILHTPLPLREGLVARTALHEHTPTAFRFILLFIASTP